VSGGGKQRYKLCLGHDKKTAGEGAHSNASSAPE
jgi:hypothetical protein